jgi:hypothetical protein
MRRSRLPTPAPPPQLAEWREDFERLLQRFMADLMPETDVVSSLLERYKQFLTGVSGAERCRRSSSDAARL